MNEGLEQRNCQTNVGNCLRGTGVNTERDEPGGVTVCHFLKERMCLTKELLLYSLGLGLQRGSFGNQEENTISDYIQFDFVL